MKILLLSDLHSVRHESWQNFLKLDENSFDIIVTLGDINGLYLKQLRDAFINSKIFGVLGNHDQKGKLSHYNIDDIHNKVISVNGIKMVGLEGSFKYKEKESVPLYDQYEMHDICENIEKVDIVLSHNSPMGIHDSDATEDIAHIGFMAIRDYIKKHNPKYSIHGHQHIDKETNYLGTKVIGVYGASILDIESGQIIKIF